MVRIAWGVAVLVVLVPLVSAQRSGFYGQDLEYVSENPWYSTRCARDGYACWQVNITVTNHGVLEHPLNPQGDVWFDPGGRDPHTNALVYEAGIDGDEWTIVPGESHTYHAVAQVPPGAAIAAVKLLPTEDCALNPDEWIDRVVDFVAPFPGGEQAVRREWVAEDSAGNPEVSFPCGPGWAEYYPCMNPGMDSPANPAVRFEVVPEFSNQSGGVAGSYEVFAALPDRPRVLFWNPSEDPRAMRINQAGPAFAQCIVAPIYQDDSPFARGHARWDGGKHVGGCIPPEPYYAFVYRTLDDMVVQELDLGEIPPVLRCDHSEHGANGIPGLAPFWLVAVLIACGFRRRMGA